MTYTPGRRRAPGRAERPGHRGEDAPSRSEFSAVIREALTDQFEPEQDALLLPADAVAETLMSMGVSTGRAGDRVGQAEPADLFPRGALTAGGDR